MTGIMIGLGVWGVLAASQQYSNDKQNQAQVSEQGVKKLRQRAKGGGGQGKVNASYRAEGEGWDGGIWGTAVRVRPRKVVLGTS